MKIKVKVSETVNDVVARARYVVEALSLPSNIANAIGEISNIGFGKPVALNELCRLVLRKYGAELEPILAELRAGT